MLRVSTTAVAEMEKDELIGNRSIAYVPELYIPPYSYGLGSGLTIRPIMEEPTFTEFSDPGAIGPTPWIGTKNAYATFLLIEASALEGVTIQFRLTPLILQDLTNAH